MRFIIVIVCTFFLLTCSKKDIVPTTVTPPIINEPPPSNSIKYLALGDSYTIGQSVPSDENYPNRISARFADDSIIVDTTIIIAVTGWTTANLDAGIANANLTDTFDLVSLLIGVNNFYQGKPLEQYKPEFEDLLLQAIDFAGGIKENVFVVSIPDYAYTPFGNGNSNISEGIDNFNAANKAITDSIGVSYFDITPISREGLDKPELVASDNLHPSGEQYRQWVELFYEDVKIKVED